MREYLRISPLISPLKVDFGCNDSLCKYWNVSISFVWVLISRMFSWLCLGPLKISTSRNVIFSSDFSTVNLNAGCISFILWLKSVSWFCVAIKIMKMSYL